MDWKQVLTRMNEIKAQHNYHATVPVTIGDKKFDMTEADVRTLQVIAKELAHTDKLYGTKLFDDFCESVIVMSGNSPSSYQMHFRHDGKFVERFDAGFYNYTSEMTFQLI